MLENVKVKTGDGFVWREPSGLGYEEFIALNTYVIQKQKAKLKEQQNKIELLEERITRLESLVNG